MRRPTLQLCAVKAPAGNLSGQNEWDDNGKGLDVHGHGKGLAGNTNGYNQDRLTASQACLSWIVWDEDERGEVEKREAAVAEVVRKDWGDVYFLNQHEHQNVSGRHNVMSKR